MKQENNCIACGHQRTPENDDGEGYHLPNQCPTVSKEEAVIRLHSFEPCILTTEEFETLTRETLAQAMADPGTVGVRVLGKLIMENNPRYIQAWEQNSGEDHPARKAYDSLDFSEN